MKKNKQLTDTQKKFIQYISLELDNNNRVIIYQNHGCFGMDFSLKTYFPKSEIITFKELKTKKKSNHIFSLAQIINSIICFIFILRNKDNYSAPTTNTITNIENIYLGIKQQQSFLKYLKIKRKPKKFKKIRYIVRIDRFNSLQIEDFKSIKFLIEFIESRKINNTLIIIDEKIYNKINPVMQSQDITFQLSDNDLKKISSNCNKKYESSDDVGLVEIVSKTGISFYLKNIQYFYKLMTTNEKINNLFNILTYILDQIALDHELTPEIQTEVYKILQLGSFFETGFTNLDIKKIDKYISTNYIDIAYDLAYITKQEKDNEILYSFQQLLLKEYFYQKYKEELITLPRVLYTFFKTNHPFSYTSIIKIISIDESTCSFEEKQTFLLLHFYTTKEIYLGIDNQMTTMINKSVIVRDLLKIYNDFQIKNINHDNLRKLNEIISRISSQNFTEIGKCAAYIMILQVVKENFQAYSTINLDDLLKKLKKSLLYINVEDYYNKYWSLHFKEQYIAFSLEIESKINYTRLNQIFYNEIIKSKDDFGFIEFIKKNSLPSLDRIKLLSNSLDLDDAENYLRDIYSSKDNPLIIKEIAKINYSALLIENRRYREANKIMSIGDFSILENLNIDTKNAYLNNYYLIKFKLGEYDLKTYIKKLSLIEKNTIKKAYNDDFIILNNLYTALLQTKEGQLEAENKLLEIGNVANTYNRFFAHHNLMIYYYLNNRHNDYITIKNKIIYPKLLINLSEQFNYKFNIIEKNWKNKVINDVLINDNKLNVFCKELFLFGTLERWFE